MDCAIRKALAAPHLATEYKRQNTLKISKSGRPEANYEYVGLATPAPNWEFDELFESFFAARLGARQDGFRALFRRLSQNFNNCPMIIETGCLRLPGNWRGDGQSTFMFDAFSRSRRGTCITVDVNLESADTARRACSSSTSVVLNDSVSFLYSLSRASLIKKIGLLYLDSFDVDAVKPLPAANHHLKELLAAWPMLQPGSIVCVDDFSIGEGGGKGGLIVDFFSNVDAEELFSDYQKAWIVC